MVVGATVLSTWEGNHGMEALWCPDSQWAHIDILGGAYPQIYNQQMIIFHLGSRKNKKKIYCSKFFTHTSYIWVPKTFFKRQWHAKCCGRMRRELKIVTLSLRSYLLNWNWKLVKVNINGYEAAEKGQMNTLVKKGMNRILCLLPLRNSKGFVLQ